MLIHVLYLTMVFAFDKTLHLNKYLISSKRKKKLLWRWYNERTITKKESEKLKLWFPKFQ